MRRLISLLILVTALPGVAQAAPPAPVPLNDGWTYQPATGPAQEVRLPHVMNPRPLPDTFAGTTATYRRAVTAPPLPPGFQWALRFEQVRRKARITVDGKTLAVHQDPYVPFTVPAPQLRPGERHELAVAVDNRKGPEPREGWWNWGGITRPVELVPQGPLILRDGALLPELDCTTRGRCHNPRFLLDGWVTNRSPERLRPWVEVLLRSPAGARTRVRVAGPMLAPGTTEHLRATVHVLGRQALWSPDSPRRYRATLTTSTTAGVVAQVDHLNVGLRKAEVREGHLWLNGRRIDLRGASIQEDIPGRGPALTDADIAETVRELQAVHANVTRAHYLLNERMLDRLDAAGILVWTQAPIFHRDVLLRTPNQRARALETLRNTMMAARNHPSTLVYSVANELSAIPSRLPPTREYLLAAARQTRQLDPTVPVAVDVLAYPSLPFDPTYRAFDALGVNSYFGWYPGKPDRPTGEVEELPAYLQRWKDRYRDQALVLTEFGAEATRSGPANEKQTYAFQADYLRRMLKAVAESPADGAIYWTLREFAVKPFWDGLENAEPRPDVATDAIHNKALLHYDGKPKPAWQVAQRSFAATPLFLGPAVNPRAEAPPAPDNAPGGLLIVLALLGVGALVVVNVRLFRTLPPEPEPMLGTSGQVVPLRRELHGDDVAIGHDVVAAFEA